MLCWHIITGKLPHQLPRGDYKFVLTGGSGQRQRGRLGPCKTNMSTMEPSMFMPSTPQLSQHFKQPRPPDATRSSLPGLPELQHFWRFVLRGPQVRWCTT